jgi:hypothetical protein
MLWKPQKMLGEKWRTFVYLSGTTLSPDMIDLITSYILAPATAFMEAFLRVKPIAQKCTISSFDHLIRDPCHKFVVQRWKYGPTYFAAVNNRTIRRYCSCSLCLLQEMDKILQGDTQPKLDALHPVAS